MYQHTLPLAPRVLDELADDAQVLSPLVEKELGVRLLPGDAQVLDPLGLEVVGHLLAGAVHNPRDLVVEDEFEVLSCVVVPNEQSVLYFHSPHDKVSSKGKIHVSQFKFE